MIPVRLRLRDFLTYTDPAGGVVELDFDGAVLWSVAGRNGAGKSALFDAITWCLFGEHRGGAREHQRLVRRGATNASVQFEFRARGGSYLVERTLTLRNARVEQGWQIRLLDASTGAWIPVPDTDRADGFNRFIEEDLGLRYKTFVASTLLLQGQSDKLMNATPKERFDILMGVLDLAYYEQLWKRVDAHARESGVVLKALQLQAETTPVVQRPDLDASDTTVADAEASATECDERFERAQAVSAGAEHYADLGRRLGVAREKRAQGEALLADAARVRERWARLRALRVVEPQVRAAVTELAEAKALDESAARSEQAATDLDCDGLTAAAQAADLATTGAVSAERSIADRVAACDERRAQLAPQLVEVEEYETIASDLARVERELAPLDVELSATDALALTVGQLKSLREALPLARTLQSARAAHDLRQEKATELGSGASARRKLAELSDTLVGLEQSLSASDTDLDTTRHDYAAATETRRLAEETLAHRRSAVEEIVCSLCGQPVDAAHIAKEVAAAEERVASALEAQARANERLAESRLQREACGTRVAAARAAHTAMDSARLLAEAAESEEGAARQRVTQAEKELEAADPAVRSLVPGLLADGAIQRGQTEAGRLPQLESRLEALRLSEGRATEMRARIAELRENAVRLDDAMPEIERSRRRSEDARLTAERGELTAAWAAARAALVAAQKALASAVATRDAAQHESESLRQYAVSERHSADALRTAATVRLSADPDWQVRVETEGAVALEALTAALTELADAPDRNAELERAESQLRDLETERRTLQEQLDDLPEPHRIAQEGARAALEDARVAREAARTALEAARAIRESLKRAHDEREDLVTRLAAATRAARVGVKLADLLGRKHLQAHLVETALGAIEQLANDTLGRISEGELHLHLELQAHAGEQQVSIEATDYSSADSRLDIRFLSGGQKFRVAVALAAAIGQFMGEGLPIGALIIDEGFGSLDTEGRRAMIAELHALSAHLERVIVVSHHEEFQDPVLFPNGYLIEKSGHHTTVTRFT